MFYVDFHYDIENDMVRANFFWEERDKWTDREKEPDKKAPSRVTATKLYKYKKFFEEFSTDEQLFIEKAKLLSSKVSVR